MPAHRTPLTLAAIAVACALAAPTATAQVERVTDPNWVTPRTAHGHPNLQGLWGNKTITPTERPDSAEGRAFLTDEEMAAAHAQRVQTLAAQDAAPARRTELLARLGRHGVVDGSNVADCRSARRPGAYPTVGVRGQGIQSRPRG